MKYVLILCCILNTGCLATLKSGLMGTAATNYHVTNNIYTGKNTGTPLGVVKDAEFEITNPVTGKKLVNSSASINVVTTIVTYDGKNIKTDEDHSDAKEAEANDLLELPIP